MSKACAEPNCCGSSGEEFLEEWFEDEDCEICERGAEGHEAKSFLGYWFAKCKDGGSE